MRALIFAAILLLFAGPAHASEAPTGTVVGRAFDPEGAPVPGVRVIVGWGFSQVETTSGPDGAFRAEGVAVGPVSAWAYPDRLDRATRVAQGYACHEEADCPRVEPGRTTTLDLALPWAAFFEGVVRDERGAPVAHARVMPGSWQMWPGETFPETDEHGQFYFALPAGHAGFSVAGDVTRYLGDHAVECLDDGLDCFHLAARETTWYNVTLPSTGVVTGILRDEHGAPVPRAFVELFDDRLPFDASRMSVDTTDEEGRFFVWSTRDGAQRLEASALWRMTELCGADPDPCIEVSIGRTVEQDAHLRATYNATFATVGFPEPWRDEDHRDVIPATLWLVRGNTTLRAGSASAWDASVSGPAGDYAMRITLRNESGQIYEGPVTCLDPPCLRLPFADEGSFQLVRTHEGVALVNARGLAPTPSPSANPSSDIDPGEAPASTFSPDPVPGSAFGALLALVVAFAMYRRS